MAPPNPSPLPNASATRRGAVSLSAQEIEGVKTFLTELIAAAGIRLTGGGLFVEDGQLQVTGAGATITLEQGSISADAAILLYMFLGDLIFQNAGAVGTPALYHQGDSSTGLWFPGGGLLALSASGQERLRIGNTSIFKGAALGTPVALASSSNSIALDMYSANNFKHTLTENTTLAAPSHPVEGQSGVMVFTQHASSPKTLAYNSFWKFPGGTVPTLTATNGAVDILSYYVESATRATCSLIKDVK